MQSRRLTSEVIEGFVGSLLAKNFDGSVSSPDCHREWWDICTGPDRFVAIAAPRGHAKTTAITISYGLAALLFRERSFAVIVSDTESQANMFLGAYKHELQTNEDLINLFGIRKKPTGEVEFIKETESDIIVEFNDGYQFRVMSKGSEQKLRGMLWNGKIRPDLILADDMENDELVMNDDRRRKFQRWFNGALLPCLSDKGIVRVVGTILHMDSQLEKLMPQEHDKRTVVGDLKTYSTKRGMWRGIKYRAHSDDFNHILWPEKKNKEEFQRYRDQCVIEGIPEVYSQEMLNIPIDESTAYFKKADFIPLKEADTKGVVRYYMTCDLAISEKERADWSAFLIAAVDEDKRIQVRNVIRERLDGREIVDTLIAMQRVYNFEAVGIEEGQISKSIGPFLNETMVSTNTYLNLFPLKHMGLDKMQRARSIQARCRAKGIKFDKEGDWYPLFEQECLRFPRDKHDDQVDAFAYLGLMLDKLIEAPTVAELKQEAYEEEFESSQLNLQGRNGTTGY